MVQKPDFPDPKPDLRSWCNPLPPQWPEKTQLEQLAGELYAPDRHGKGRDRLIRSVRHGSIVEICDTFLLAVTTGRADVRKRDLVAAMDEIEDRGGIIRELSTGDETPKRRRRMRERAFEAITAHAKGRRSAANGTLSTGAPQTWPRSGPVFEGYRTIWESRRYKNDNQRLTAIVKNFGAAPSRVWLRNMLGSPHDAREAPPSTVKRPKFRKRAQLVYFIRRGSAVKIGVSHNPARRMADMATSNHGKLELLSTMKGGSKREQALHRKFAAHHIKGEWYKLVPQIAEYIRKHRSDKA